MVRSSEGGYHVLLIRDPYRNWGLPKGHIEDEEAPDMAALREVREETGLDDLHVGPSLGTIDWRFRLDGRLVHKYCQFFLMASRSSDAVPEVDEGITECVWLPVDEAIGRITYDNAREMIRAAVERLPAAVNSFPPWQ